MKQFTIEQIRAAFWNAFHKQGEVWFEYISDEQYCEGTTNAHWDVFKERLVGGVVKQGEAHKVERYSMRVSGDKLERVKDPKGDWIQHKSGDWLRYEGRE